MHKRGFMRLKLAILASGSGTNAENIIRYFKGNEEIEVACVISNKADAYVLERAKREQVPSVVFSKKYFEDGSVLKFLQQSGINFIVLAGFLLRVPENLLVAYPQRIVNIHPALLPKYGGKGMYGSYVHEAVVASGDRKTGITIHYINEHYDEGDIIFQATCEVLPQDTPDQVASKVHELEYRYFPSVIEKVLKQL